MAKISERILSSASIGSGLLIAGSSPASAQSNENSDRGALGDVIIDALKDLLRILFSPIESVIESHGDAVLRVVVGTPHPNAVFSKPTNGAWPGVYDYYWQMVFPLALSLFGLSVGLIIFLESTSHLFNEYHRSKLKKRGFAGLLGILSWWWIASLSMRFIDALAGFLVPSMSEITLFQTLSFTGMGVLGTVVALSTNFVLFVLIGLIYLSRQISLYLFVFLMPLLIVFWIPGVGPFKLVSKFMKKLAGFYVPFLFMTVPVAILFRLGNILGTSFDISASGFGAWLTALVIPLIAVVSPLILFWQAGAMFFIAERAARHFSAKTARRRFSRGQEGIESAKQGGKNFVRGVRDDPAIKRSGQYVLNSGKSRAHATGRRLNTTGSRLRDAITEDGEGERRGGNGGFTNSGGEDTGSSENGEEFEREDVHRDPQEQGRIRDSKSEIPRYIQ
jgi:hypothetical protein